MRKIGNVKWCAILFLAACLIFVPAACWVFHRQHVKLEQEFHHMAADNLMSYTRTQKSYLDSSVADARNTLEGIAGLIEYMDLSQEDGWLDGYLEDLSRLNGDYRITYISMGDLEKELRERQAAESTWEFIRELKDGAGVVSDIRHSELQKDAYVFTIGEPVMKNGQAAGVLRTRLDPIEIAGRTPQSSAFTKCSTLIVRQDGTLLATNNQNYRDTATDNLFTSMESAGIPKESVDLVREQFQGTTSDSISFKGKGHEYYFSWDTLECNGWYIADFVRSPDVALHYDNILKGVITASMLLVFLAVALGGGILVLILRHQRNLDQEEKKYGLLEAFTDTALFIYDKKKDLLEFTSNARRILMLDKLRIEHVSKEKERMELFLPEDRRNIEALLKKIPGPGPEEIRYTELSLKSVSGEYHWFGCHYKAVTSSSGAVEQVVGKLADISRQHSREQALREQAMRDVLTDTYNKAGEQIISRLLKERRSGLFLMLDLDDFKGVNDTKGHAAGDAILAEVGKALNQVCREDDIVARIGGDEFVLFLPRPFDRHGAQRKVREIQRGLGEAGIAALGIVGIKASIGAALYPEDGADYEALYLAADKAMYRAKGQSKCQAKEQAEGMQKNYAKSRGDIYG